MLINHLNGSSTTGESKFYNHLIYPWLIIRTFGRLHTHPTSGQPAGHPQFHLVYRDGSTPLSNKDPLNADYYADRLTSTGWHSDVTYELQPPGLTTLFLYATPESGGDTAYVSQVGMSSFILSPLLPILHFSSFPSPCCETLY